MSKLTDRIRGILNDEGDVYHVDVMDGIRAISILLVLWFHFWQQTWLMPVYQTPFLKWMGVSAINPNDIRWVGYIFVDMMILLSAFSLFLPHARTMILGEPVPSIKRFYQKRVARILPSYLASVLILFIIAAVNGTYSSYGAMFKDLATHLTFTQMFWRDTYIYTQLNVVLWTVSLLVQFYLVFPWLAWAFRKLHIFIYAVMVAVGLFITFIFTKQGSDMSMYVNQFPTFLPVFANGMAAAYLYVWFTKKCRWRKLLSPLFTAGAIVMIVLMLKMADECFKAYPNGQFWQMENRYLLSLVFTGFLLFSAFAIKPYRFLFSNSIVKGIALISFNLYIWHQWIIVKVRESFGFISGQDVTNAGANMQWTITIEALIISIIVAVIMTYCVEKPFAKLILKNYRRKENALSI